MARVGIWTTAGLVVGTIGQVATGDALWSAVGAGAGAVLAVILNRLGPRAVR
jgi:outer membrane lipoprotein SlyB